MHVLVTDRRYPEEDLYTEVVDEFGGELTVLDGETEEELRDACEGVDVIVTRLVPVSEETLAQATDLKLIMRLATGYDNIDVRTATARGIPVSNVPGYAARDIANHAIALCLTAAHDILEADRSIREGPGWGNRKYVKPLHGGTFGVVGLGRIDRETIPMARGLNMDVIAYDPYLPDDVFDLLGVRSVEFEELLAEANAISIHAPISELTHHLFSTRAFEMMKESSVLVNAARGPIVDEAALVAAIERDEIHAAALDVFESEPPDGSPILEHDRIVCSQHRAGHTENAKRNIISTVRAELRRVLNGESPRNVVNAEVYQYRSAAITEPGM